VIDKMEKKPITKDEVNYLLQLGSAATTFGVIVYLFPLIIVLLLAKEYIQGITLSLFVILVGIIGFIIIKLTKKQFYQKALNYLDDEGIYKQIMEKIEQKQNQEDKNKHQLKVYKINETENYGKIFVINLPTQFFFDKDGTYDGFEIDVMNVTENEEKLIEEFCKMFPGKYHYTIEEDNKK